MSVWNVPWANLEKGVGCSGTATGLWTLGGKVLTAPPTLLDSMPEGVPIDGEAWHGRGEFETSLSLRAFKDGFSPAWDNVQMVVLDLISPHKFADPRTIDYGRKIKKTPNWSAWHKWVAGAACSEMWKFERPYVIRQSFLKDETKVRFGSDPRIRPLRSLTLNGSQSDILRGIREEMDKYCELGAEGIMLQDPYAYWTPDRCKGLLRWKDTHDDEGIIVGYTEGENDFTGMLGAYLVQWKKKLVKVGGGIKISERRNPKPIGTTITFKYRKLSQDGVPVEARMKAEREDY